MILYLCECLGATSKDKDWVLNDDFPYAFVSHAETMLDFEHYQITYNGVGLIEIGSLPQPVHGKIT